MRQDGWEVAPAGFPTASELTSPNNQREAETYKQHEGWKIWQKVVDATADSMQGVASAVRLRVNAEDRLCGKAHRHSYCSS